MDIGDVDMEKKVQSKTHLLTCVIYNLDYTVIQVPSQWSVIWISLILNGA